MSEDHLNNEVSLSAELTESGIKAGAKSRTISAIDRLLGGVVDLANVPIERIALKGRAKTDTQVATIKALGGLQLEAIHSDPDFAARAMHQHFKVVGMKHNNKTEAVRLALEDLRENPPSDEQNNSGGDRLDDAFVNRWERFAEDATSEQLREKWGRVLASEIRTPGIFSSKVMRVVEELEPETAILFERICSSRIGITLIGCLIGEIDYLEEKRLVAADLLVEPGMSGQVMKSSAITLSDHRSVNMFSFGSIAVAIDASEKLPTRSKFGRDTINEPIIVEDDSPRLPVYILTDVGHAISSIINHDEISVAESYLSNLNEKYPDLSFIEFRKNDQGGYSLFKEWKSVNSTNTSAGVVPVG